jgi:hypothetical protein
VWPGSGAFLFVLATIIAEKQQHHKMLLRGIFERESEIISGGRRCFWVLGAHGAATAPRNRP